MWIVLLDRSGSMGDPFEHSGDPSRRTRIVNEEIKLEAAKEAARKAPAGTTAINKDGKRLKKMEDGTWQPIQ